MRDGVNETSRPAAIRLAGRLRRRVRSYYRRWFCDRNYIFRHDGPFLPVDRADCTFEQYRSPGEVPSEIKSEIRRQSGERRLETDLRELSHNATLWVAIIDGQLASSVFTRQGEHFRRWFVPLSPGDSVAFRGRTHEAFRGRGLAPSLIGHALHHSVEPGAHAYTDCRTYNKPSIRCIEKLGFKLIATMRSIRREWALDE
jgi:RimJ/RimL family protein N-acetyltransferase